MRVRDGVTVVALLLCEVRALRSRGEVDWTLSLPDSVCVQGGPALNAAELRGPIHASKAPSTLTTARFPPVNGHADSPQNLSASPRHDVEAT